MECVISSRWQGDYENMWLIPLILLDSDSFLQVFCSWNFYSLFSRYFINNKCFLLSYTERQFESMFVQLKLSIHWSFYQFWAWILWGKNLTFVNVALTLSQGLFSQRWTGWKKVMGEAGVTMQYSRKLSPPRAWREELPSSLRNTAMVSWMETQPEPRLGGAEAKAPRPTSFPALPQPKPDLGHWEQEMGREVGVIIATVNNSPWVLEMTLRDLSLCVCLIH